VDADEIKRIAYHEAGHALACYLVYSGEECPLLKLSIEAQHRFTGNLWWDNAGDYPSFADRACAEQALQVMLGGMAGERLLFGEAWDAAELEEAADWLQNAGWLADTSPRGSEVRAYAMWLRLRIENVFKSRHCHRDALDALVSELLQRRTIPYVECKRIISGIIEAAPRPELEAVKRGLKAKDQEREAEETLKDGQEH
jgi:ATP-dependent Zn protease